MLGCNWQCRGMMRKVEDDRLRTVDCLRGRLLAERVAAKAAKEEAESLAKTLEELQRKLDEETKCRNRAEKRLKLALKKLESLKHVGSQLVPQDSSTSSLSPQCFLGQERLEEQESGSPTVDSGQCGSLEVAKEMLRSLSGDDMSGTVSPSVCSHHQLTFQDQGSWSSVGTAQSYKEEEPCEDKANKDVDAQLSLTEEPIFWEYCQVRDSNPSGRK